MAAAHFGRAASAPEGIYIPLNPPPSAATSLTIEMPQQQQDQDLNLRGRLNANGQSPGSCRVCGEVVPKLTGDRINAVTSCGHVMCYECALRSIFVTKREVDENGEKGPAKCPVCRDALAKVVITRKTVQDQVIAKNLLQSQQSRKYLDVVFYDDYNLFDAIKWLISFPCNGCNFDFTKHLGQFKKNAPTFAYISKHIKDKHDSYICELCFYNLEQFPMELTVFGGHGRLRNHLRKGDTNVEHQLCTLCDDGDKLKLMSNTYFDKEALAAHCQKVHFNCNVCNLPNTFFLDEKALAEHVAKWHITCHIGKRTNDLVAGFPNAVDLGKHLQVKHSAKGINNELLAKNANDKKAASSLDIQSLHIADKVGASVEAAQTQVNDRRAQQNNIPQGPSGNIGPSWPSVGTSSNVKYGREFPNFKVVGEPSGQQRSVGNTGGLDLPGPTWNTPPASNIKTNQLAWQTQNPPQVDNPAFFVSSVPKALGNKVVSPFSETRPHRAIYQPVPAKDQMFQAGFSNKAPQKHYQNPKQLHPLSSRASSGAGNTRFGAAGYSVSHAGTQSLTTKMDNLNEDKGTFRGRGRGRGTR